MKVLLTGASGQLGKCFQDLCPNDWELFAFTSEQLDITEKNKVINNVNDLKVDVVVNAAAYTAVDKAEKEPEKAFAVNATGVANLAAATNNINARLIHVSTDYVFSGKKQSPYTVDDAPNPINVYGKSKLAGELLALAHNPKTQIIRTSWVYSEHGNNFVKTMLRLARQGKQEISVVSDQVGCPTYAGNLAQYIINQIVSSNADKILHYSDGKVMSWYEFAVMFFGVYKSNTGKQPEIKPIVTSEYPTLAERPRFSVLDTKVSLERSFLDFVDQLVKNQK